MSVPTVAKLRILFVEDLISPNLTCSDPAKSKKLNSMPRINFEKSSVERPSFIDCVKSLESLPIEINPTETSTPINIKLIPCGSFRNFTLMYENSAASVIKTENKRNNCIFIEF